MILIRMQFSMPKDEGYVQVYRDLCDESNRSNIVDQSVLG